jgi:hypothetical protein
MHTDGPPLIALPHDLSDEAAAALLELLYAVAHALESHYAGQLHRYYLRPDPRQQDLWDGRDPPF